jgi:serine/threonine-protein kinase
MPATTADFGTCREFVAELSELRLLAPRDLERINAYTRAFPARGPEQLADFLVEQGVLTRFQADAALKGEARQLVLPSYTLTAVLGSGSMGTVYKGKSSKDESSYAIKIVPRRNVATLNNLGEKVQALKQVRHPRVSALVHIGAQGERVYLVWPFLDGGEKLDALVRRQGQLAPRQAVQIALQVASGLQAYHEHGLFHGLLKPSDVLIGSDRRVRVLDFGVGFLLTSERGKSLLDTMTNNRTLARGLDCASPESLIDALDRTPAGDQYSLGCILYFCLAGRFPFTDDNPVKKMMAHQCEEPTPVRELAPDVPPRLAALVHRLLRKTPDERYPSSAELVKELQSLSGGFSSGKIPAAGRICPPVTPIAGTPQVEAAAAVKRKPAPATPPAGKQSPASGASPGGWGVGWLVLTGLAAGTLGGLVTWLVTRSS